MRKNFTVSLLLLAIFAAMLCPAKAQNASTQLVSAVNELKQQQAQIADNQTKIDSKIADLVETIRVARIFMSRAGGDCSSAVTVPDYRSSCELGSNGNVGQARGDCGRRPVDSRGDQTARKDQSRQR